MTERKHKFRTESGTMKVSAQDAMERLGLGDRLRNSYNAWAAVITLKNAPEMDDEAFLKTYRISKDEARALRQIMYPND